MEIMTLGGGGRQKECERILRESCAVGQKLILLPIPTSRDDKYITGTDCSIDKILGEIDEKTVLVGYALPERLLRSGARVYDASLDEDFLVENAVITAKGTLGYILTHYDRDISELNIGIVGYGRIGKALLRLFLLMDSATRLYTTRESVALELGGMGVHAEIPDDTTDLSTIDILINTAPARVIDEERIPPQLDIIDLASGNIFKPGERLIKLRSIPDSMYPKTAGGVYARHILDFLGREGLI